MLSGTLFAHGRNRVLGAVMVHRASANTGSVVVGKGISHAFCTTHRPRDASKNTVGPGAQCSDSAAETLAKNKAPVIRRFWKNTAVEERDGKYIIALDKRPIKTPSGKQIQIPESQRTLAWLVAGEWESQKEVLGSHSLPLTSLVFRSIDGLSDPHVHADVVSKLLKYFQTDSVCLHEEHPQTLVALQQKHYTPIVDWAKAEYGIDIQTTPNIFALRQQPQAVENLRNVVSEFSPLKLAALEKAVMTAKSFLIGLALVEQRLSVEEAAVAAQVEASSQTQLWGELENAHDIDNAAIRQILGASACVALGA
ncbi:chaperone [Coemansia sp. RSA 1813]|nr:ATP synthase mitochondrial F1 complex assembly factor 2 [Coemansia sp. RSA 1646]KAJ1765845.1 chaperone [Coemansia sp. RSA 1843]KAJ2087005.1 chaperone [Coemansia sp. RSA 986]KAJ2215576.1 chaperone [Coemansia sp. RSA 487]KAJ2565431.1 chaperone [Coemansia sp. RSA 1813]